MRAGSRAWQGSRAVSQWRRAVRCAMHTQCRPALLFWAGHAKRRRRLQRCMSAAAPRTAAIAFRSLAVGAASIRRAASLRAASIETWRCGALPVAIAIWEKRATLRRSSAEGQCLALGFFFTRRGKEGLSAWRVGAAARAVVRGLRARVEPAVVARAASEMARAWTAMAAGTTRLFAIAHYFPPPPLRRAWRCWCGRVIGLRYGRRVLVAGTLRWLSRGVASVGGLVL